MDTCADEGLWIARRVVEGLGFQVPDSNTKAQVRGADDKIISSQGLVTLDWRTPEGVRTYRNLFNVFESQYIDVLLGKEFLGHHKMITINKLLLPLLTHKPESTRKFLRIPLSYH
jgi:hypothetical protein